MAMLPVRVRKCRWCHRVLEVVRLGILVCPICDLPEAKEVQQ